jgi:uncharacterized protein (DUF1015 family)
MAYNRVVADLAGRSPQELLDAVAGVAELVAAADVVVPRRPHEVGLYLDRRWWVLRFPDADVDERDPLGRLDVSLLQDRVLGPLLGIGDPRTDPRISFVGGIRGPEEVARRVDAGAGAGFVLFPTSTGDLVRVADAGLVMPPKSTWFEPKLASGLVLHPLDGEG